jgi:hypothetical protein
MGAWRGWGMGEKGSGTFLFKNEAVECWGTGTDTTFPVLFLDVMSKIFARDRGGG